MVIEARRASVGSVIGKYVVVDTLGVGSNATVMLASPLGDPSGQKVAIKLADSTQEAQAQAQREAQTLRSVTHPNLIRLIEVIDDASGTALVLEWAERSSLAARLARGPITDVQELAELIAPIADALAALHAAGFVHRDVKPENIVLRADHQPLLGDLGVACRVAEQRPGSDVALGSVEYLDPEVANGADSSGSSDLYALGCTAYEALTGDTPFAASSPLAVLRNAHSGTFTP